MESGTRGRDRRALGRVRHRRRGGPPVLSRLRDRRARGGGALRGGGGVAVDRRAARRRPGGRLPRASRGCTRPAGAHRGTPAQPAARLPSTRCAPHRHLVRCRPRSGCRRQRRARESAQVVPTDGARAGSRCRLASHPQRPRSGGANEDVLRMLQEIGDPAKAEAFIEARLGARGALSKAERANPKARVPGFGHRVYRVDDARARVLRGMAKSMAEATGRARLFEVAERVYDAMKARTDLPVNVDFFSAVVYDALGIPADLCTSIFAIGRVAGWCAHAMEQYADNRLIRPRAEYIGVAPRRLAAAVA